MRHSTDKGLNPVGVHIRVTLVGVLAAENITSSYSTLIILGPCPRPGRVTLDLMSAAQAAPVAKGTGGELRGEVGGEWPGGE